jgi:ubiquitin C-terminal hydrolase
MTIHKGNSLRGGHYFSIVNRNNRWFECNDNKINELKPHLFENEYILFDKIEKDYIFKNGYLFFYRKNSTL